MKDMRQRGGYWKKPAVWGSLGALFGATLFSVAIIGMVVLPVRESKRASWLQIRIQSRYIAEDVMLRALQKKGFFESGHALIPEGELAPDPTLPARVSLRWGKEGNVLVARLRGGDKELVYEGSYGYGELLSEYSLALGQGDPAGEWNPTEMLIQGGQARLKLAPLSIVEDAGAPTKDAADSGAPATEEPRARIEKSLLTRHLGAVKSFDLLVRGGSKRVLDRESSARNCFRRTETLPQQYLAKPTDLDDFALRSAGPDSGTIVFDTQKSMGLRIRVEGNLWLGQPGQTLRISTQGRPLVIHVTGNLYVMGDVTMVGERDALFLLIGKPGAEAYRDEDGNGHRDPLEPRIPGRSPRLFPSEGSGLAYLGLPGTQRTRLEAFLVTEHDVIVGEKGASVRGTVLAGGRLIRCSAEQPGMLELFAGARFRDMSLPIPGLPSEPGSETLPRVLRVGLAEVRDFRY